MTVEEITDPGGSGWLPIAEARRERADAASNRARILQAAVRVLDQRGAQGTSIDAVAAEAGVGKGTVFRRFGDRSGLFQALLSEHLRAFQDAFIFGPPPLGPGAPPEDRLTAFLEGLLDLCDTRLEVMLALELERMSGPIGGYMVLTVHVESLVGQICPGVDAAVVTQLLLNALNPHLVRYLRREAGASLEAIKVAVRVLVAGLASAG